MARRQNVLFAAATVAVLGLAYGPMTLTFFAQQWAKPHYQYFPFVLGAFVWLMWRNSKMAQPRAIKYRRLNYFGLITLAAIAWALLALAYLANSPWLAVISAILLAASCFLRVSSEWRVGYLWGIWAILWLVIPPPLNRDQQLINWLQHLSSRLSSVLLDWFGVEHLMEGNTLLLPDKQLFVDEACSGIVSVLSIIACAVIYGVWRNRPPIHVILLALAGICWATLMNVVRITVIAIAFDWWRVDWSTGTSHELLGLMIFSLIFLAVASTDYLLLGLLAPIATRNGEPLGEPLNYGAKLVAVWDWLQQWGTPRLSPIETKSATAAHPSREIGSRLTFGLVGLFAFASLGGAQIVIDRLFAPTLALSEHGVDRALTLDHNLLATPIAGLQQINFKRQERELTNTFGQYSRIYEFQDDKGARYLVSCDFPFGPEWHDLTVCYAGVGWDLAAVPKTCSSAARNQESWDYVEASFIKQDGSAADLVYCVFDENGRTLDPPTHSIINDIWLTLGKQYRLTRTERLFQIQVFTIATGKIREEQRVTARDLLLRAREQFREFIAQGAGSQQVAGG